MISSLISLIALLLLYFISLVIITNQNKSKAIEEINIYLELASSYYEDGNYKEVSDTLLSIDDNLRITFIDLSGSVLYDSKLGYDVSNLDNHLTRPEIENLEEVIVRKSDSFNENMMYIATLVDDCYIRISFATVYFTTANLIYAISAFSAIIFIYLIELLILYFISKKMLKPIESRINSLANLVEDEVTYKANTLDELPQIITAVSNSIDNKINLIREENIKNETIIEAITECLILIKDNVVTSLNNQTLKTFKVTKEAVLNKNYIYLFRNTSLLDAVEKASQDRFDTHLMIKIDENTYDVTIIPFSDDQILVTLKDVTTQEKVELVKKDFFANASHELKSPLTSIIGYEQMILNGIIEDKKEIKEASQQILKEANRMNQIIIDMLELSNLEFVKEYELSENNLKDILEDILKSLETKIKERNITLITDIKDAYLFVNKPQIEMLFLNLIDNAIKYNKINGTLKISLDENSFTVEDTGIGISKEDQTRVFERFYRVNKTKSTNSTGLGLAIVKHICEKFNYEINLTSVLDIGTKITILFKKN